MQTSHTFNRVGGRPAQTPTTTGGGRYQDICRIFAACLNPRTQKKNNEKIEVTIKDLKKIGLPGKWLQVAEHLGAEKWIEIWEILDRENIDHPSPGRSSMRLRVPMYARFVKHLRNRYIYQLTDIGATPKEIYKYIKKADIEPISTFQIRAIQAEYLEGHHFE